jgi:membrane peptidoglycan carboxypeptidase
VHCNAVAITGITDRDGKRVRTPSPDCERKLKAGVADGVNQLLTSVMTQGTGRTLQIGRPVAGKTGTTNENAAVWFAGHTPQLAAAAWIGDPRGGQQYPIRDITINGRFISRGFGGLLAGPIWRAVMVEGSKGLEKKRFPLPDPSVVAGLPTRVPDVRGQAPAEALGALEAAGLRPTVTEYRVYSSQPENTVAYTSPGSGSRVTSGREVQVYLSDGPAPPPPPPPVTQAPPATGPPSPGTTPSALP